MEGLSPTRRFFAAEDAFESLSGASVCLRFFWGASGEERGDKDDKELEDAAEPGVCALDTVLPAAGGFGVAGFRTTRVTTVTTGGEGVDDDLENHDD